MARPVRERLLNVIPGHQPGVIIRFYLMHCQARECGRAGNTLSCNSAEPFDSMGEEVRQLPNPSAGIGPQPHMAKRVQGPQVRLTHAGVGSLTVATPISRNLTRSGVLPKKADHEKLNDDRGASPCQSATAETKPNREKTKSEWVRGRFCILTPEISSEFGTGNYAGTGVPHIPEWIGRKVLTDVTAVAESQTNRARSEVSGVVSSAGQVCQCFKHLRLMRVLRVGRAARLDATSARQSKGRVRAYEWCRAQLHTRKE